MTISIERKHDGSLVLSAIVDGYLVQRRYYGYGKQEARRMFKEDVK